MRGDGGEERLTRALPDGGPGVEAQVLQLVVQAHPQLVERRHVGAAGELREDLAAVGRAGRGRRRRRGGRSGGLDGTRDEKKDKFLKWDSNSLTDIFFKNFEKNLQPS